MFPQPHLIGIQAALFAGLAALAVFIYWIRSEAGGRGALCSTGLLALGTSGLLAYLGLSPDFSPLAVTTGHLLLLLGLRPGRPSVLSLALLGVVLVCHAAILWATEPGFVPRESANQLVWAGLSIAVAAGLIPQDDTWPGRPRLPLFLLFGTHALFCLGIASAFQAGMLAPGVTQEGAFLFILGTELSLFASLIAFFLILGALRDLCETQALELNRLNSLPELLPVCSCCHKIRNEDQSWSHLETYLSARAGMNFTHGICPGCASSLYPGIDIGSTEAKPQKTSPALPRLARRHVSRHPFAEVRPLQ